jgi:hypothetical protein
MKGRSQDSNEKEHRKDGKDREEEFFGTQAEEDEKRKQNRIRQKIDGGYRQEKNDYRNDQKEEFWSGIESMDKAVSGLVGIRYHLTPRCRR